MTHRSAAELYGLEDLIADTRWRGGTTWATARLWPINCWLMPHERPVPVEAAWVA